MYGTLSRSLPLEICLQHVGRKYRQIMQPKSYNGRMLDMLVPLGMRTRIRNLIIHKKWIPLGGRCQFLDASLPNLETLAITSDIGWENESNEELLARLRGVFKGGMPSLLRLFIPECTPWPNNNFKNLKLLCLYNQSGLELELPELLQMLRGSPTIEELYIRQREHSERINGPPPNLGPTFQAHSLRKLRFHDFSSRAIAPILSTMQLQPNGVAVYLSDTIMAADALAQILPLFPPGCTLGSTEKLEVYHESQELFGSCSVAPEVR